MIHRIGWTVIAALALALGAPAAQSAATVAIRGGTVLTVTRGTIANGVVVIRDGKLAAVGGAETPVPPGAEVVDASGRFVTPGIIDAHSHIAADSINEGGTTVSSMTGIEDVLDPTDVNVFRDLAGGLTVANVLHGSANPIGGTNAVIKLRWGKTRASELLFEGALPGIKFALGENPKDMRFGSRGGPSQVPRRYPATRPGVEFVIRDAFTRAKAYQREWQDYERRRKAAPAAAPAPVAPRRDLQLEPLVEILEGRRLVHAHSYRADEILMLIRLADEMGFKIATFQHVLEGYKVADEIAAHGAGASTFSDWWAYKVEAEDAIPHNAAIMHKRGVLVSINSDSAEHARRLNTEAAKSIHWGGISEDEALAFVTINPARQLRVDNRVGSLEAGKDADVVIWNKHPLSTYAIADRVYIDGQVYYDRVADERRLTDARAEKSRLAADLKSAASERASAAASGPNSADESPVTPAVRAAPAVRPAAPAPAPATARAQPGAAAAGPTVAITHARIHPITGPPVDNGHDRDPRRRHRIDRSRGRGAGRSPGDRCQGRGRLSRVHRRAHDAGAGRAGCARVRGRAGDAGRQRRRARAVVLSRRRRCDSGRPRQRRHHRGRDAGGRSRRRPGGRHEPRRLDVGGSHPAAGCGRDRAVSQPWAAAGVASARRPISRAATKT